MEIIDATKEKTENEELGLQKSANDALEYVKALEVEDQKSLDLANRVVVRIGQIRKEIIAYFKDPKTKAKATHQAIVDKEKEALKPVIEADVILKPKVGAYVRKQLRIQEEAERKAREETERKEREQEKALKEAAELEDRGKIKEAQTKLVEAEKMDDETKEVPLPQAPVMSGTHTVTYWRFRIIEIDEIPRAYMIPNESMIAAAVKEFKELTKIPGIEAYKITEVVRSRS